MKFLYVDLDKRREMILQGNIVKTVLFLTMPTFLMSLVQVLIPFSDGLFLNKILGTDVGAAVSYIQPAINILISASSGIGVVCMAMIGKLNGRGDDEGVRKVSLQAIIFGLVISLLLMPLCLIGSVILAPDNIVIRDYVITYFSLNVFLIPFLFMAAIFNSIKSAMGEPESTFYRMSLLLILKILFNKIFLIDLGFGIEGAIYASFCAYFITTLWMIYDLFIKESKFKLSLRKFRFDKDIIFELVRLGIPSSLTYIAIGLGFLLINFEVEKYGTDVLAGLSIASQINSVCFTIPTCISTTVTTMISMNMGVNNIKKSKEVYLKSLLISLILGIILIVVVMYYSIDLLNLYEPSLSVRKTALESLRIHTFSVIPFAAFIITQSVFNALGRNNMNLFMSILRMWLFRYLFIVATENYLGYFSVFYGNLFSNTFAALIYFILVYKIEWRSHIKYE